MGSDSPILVYQDFVELTCNEDDGYVSSSVSKADLHRNGARLRQTNSAQGILLVDSDEDFRDYNERKRISSLRNETFGRWNYFEHCPHCNTKLTTNTLNIEGFRGFYTSECPCCGWWETEHFLSEEFDSYGFKHGVKSFHRRSILKSFSVSSAEVPVENLCEYLTHHPQKLEDVDPGKLEELVGHVFRETHKCEVSYVGGPNDRGIDLYLARGDQEMVVQVKRRALRRGAQPASSVREFVGAMVIQGALRGIFVTSGKFSKAAVREADDASRREPITSIELVDGGRLIAMCELTRPIMMTKSSYSESDMELNLSEFNNLIGFSMRNPINN
ncbi:restriction endonuclease [Pinisolibacter sp.]|uniref:restriction endonuclease n=1 Tax=Pinisolibacter sp. TaxID=2172024 RepID=UPI002FDD0164